MAAARAPRITARQPLLMGSEGGSPGAPPAWLWAAEARTSAGQPLETWLYKAASPATGGIGNEGEEGAVSCNLEQLVQNQKAGAPRLYPGIGTGGARSLAVMGFMHCRDDLGCKLGFRYDGFYCFLKDLIVARSQPELRPMRWATI